MESVRQYREEFPERAAHKLFMPFNKDGKLNDKLPDVARSLEEELSKYDAYVGLMYRGSMALGYSQDGSDADFVVMYDTSDPTAYTNLFEAVRRLHHSKPDRVHEVQIFTADVNPKSIAAMVKGNSDVKRSYGSANLAALCGIARGTKIKAHRDSVRELLGDLSREKRQEIAELAGKDLADWEVAHTGRIEERMPELKRNPQWGREAFYNDRKALWTKRVEHIIGVEAKL